MSPHFVCSHLAIYKSKWCWKKVKLPDKWPYRGDLSKQLDKLFIQIVTVWSFHLLGEINGIVKGKVKDKQGEKADSCKTEERVFIHMERMTAKEICITGFAWRPELEESCLCFLFACLADRVTPWWEESLLSDQQPVSDAKDTDTTEVKKKSCYNEVYITNGPTTYLKR